MVMLDISDTAVMGVWARSDPRCGRRGAAVFSRNRRRRASRRPPVSPPDPDGTVPALSRFVPPGRVSKTAAVSTRRPATSTPASKSPTRIVEPEAWHKSGKEVPAALSASLLLSHRGDAHAPVSETAVLFSADGRTARTHVPMRSGGGIVVHEQL